MRSATDLGSHPAHLVHFYRSDQDLACHVAPFLLESLRAGEAALIVASPLHVGEFRQAMAASGYDVDAAVTSGRLVILDAATTLRQLMVGDLPDADRFNDVIGNLMARLAHASSTRLPGVHAYGEMVGELWGAGNVVGAIALEELWQALGERMPFSLYCGYATSVIAAGQEEAVQQALRLHDHVVAPPPRPAVSSARARFTKGDRAPAEARRFVARFVGKHSPALVDASCLVVSELATNAVVHAQSDFAVDVVCSPLLARVSVSDGSARMPESKEGTDTSALSGRGLQLVRALSRNWGTEPLEGGKAVWADIGP